MMNSQHSPRKLFPRRVNQLDLAARKPDQQRNYFRLKVSRMSRMFASLRNISRYILIAKAARRSEVVAGGTGSFVDSLVNGFSQVSRFPHSWGGNGMKISYFH